MHASFHQCVALKVLASTGKWVKHIEKPKVDSQERVLIVLHFVHLHGKKFIPVQFHAKNEFLNN